MTVIVWDGTTLAADTRETFGNTPTRTSKLLHHRSKIKPDGKNRLVLFGMAGISSECAEARRRIAAGKELLRQDFTDIQVLAVDEGGRVWVTGPDFYWREHPIILGGRNVCAVGSGANSPLEMKAQLDALPPYKSRGHGKARPFPKAKSSRKQNERRGL